MNDRAYRKAALGAENLMLRAALESVLSPIHSSAHRQPAFSRGSQMHDVCRVIWRTYNVQSAMKDLGWDFCDERCRE